MSPSLAVIIQNYKRPQNVGRIARAARQGLPGAAILVLDQAETDTFHERNDVDWPDIWLQRSDVNRGTGARVPLVTQLPFDHYIAIDDDVFLTAAQIFQLAQQLRAAPDRAHGIFGERLQSAGGANINVLSGITRVNWALSNLNQVYAFTRAQAAAALELSAALGSAWEDVGATDDILLSCAATQPPLCHDLGPIAYCPTSDDPQIACWKSDGFTQRRVALYSKLMAAGAVSVFPPLPQREAQPSGRARPAHPKASV
jgi:hypothetical protein